MLGPIDKYRKYNRFPWKFLVHITMCVVTTLQVIYVTQYSLDYAYNMRSLFNNLFMTGPDGTVYTQGQHIMLYDIPTLQTFVQNTVDNYYSLNST